MSDLMAVKGRFVAAARDTDGAFNWLEAIYQDYAVLISELELSLFRTETIQDGLADALAALRDGRAADAARHIEGLLHLTSATLAA